MEIRVLGDVSSRKLLWWDVDLV